ncbi:MAG: benzoate-CoA ligase family protein [Betaproteobacteria bacterium]|nr:benzoate-CoA ligase family protein [Betaproteobacteria bacterium]
MRALSSADHRVSPPMVTIPRQYNAADDLIGRNLAAGRQDKPAFIDDAGTYTYADVDRRASQFANVLRKLGIDIEQRILLCMHDSIDFPSAFLGALRAGVVPVAVNTVLTQGDYEYMLADSRARVAVVSAPLLPLFMPLLPRLPSLRRILVSGEKVEGTDELASLMAAAGESFETARTTCDDPCFWLYSSGSTGAPKGTVHVHSSMIQTAELYARPVLGIDASDVVFSAAKLFFAYGLGNGLSFPMAVGATAILMAERATPAAVFARLRTHRPTIFYGVPTLYAAMLAHPDLPPRDASRLRRCVSAGEALPEEIGKRWSTHFGVDILDGIGSTEMLHIFLSNRPGDVRYGTTGKPVPGYELRIVDDQGAPLAQGETGELQIAGPTSAAAYWNNREKTRATFQGMWTRSGDKYSQDADGYFVYAGRSDDMLKVSGLYVSPVEVEASLITHESVLEAAVVGREDDDRLTKPMAFVVLKPGHAATPELTESLKAHVKSRLAPYKYPRWFAFVEELPKTATGKIQRFKLRALAGGR